MELLLTMMDKSGTKADCLREIKSSVLDIFKFKCKLVIQTERSSGPLDIQVWNRDSSVEEITINVHSNGWNGNLNKIEFPHRRPTSRSQENKEPPAERSRERSRKRTKRERCQNSFSGAEGTDLQMDSRETWRGRKCRQLFKGLFCPGLGGGRQRGGWRPYCVAL